MNTNDDNSTLSQDESILIAMMLLEMGTDGLNPEYGTAHDYMTAAHSFLQAGGGGSHSWDGAEAMLARIRADSEAQDRPHH